MTEVNPEIDITNIEVQLIAGRLGVDLNDLIYPDY